MKPIVNCGLKMLSMPMKCHVVQERPQKYEMMIVSVTPTDVHLLHLHYVCETNSLHAMSHTRDDLHPQPFGEKTDELL
jgi:hypothetical protein